jgi:hypothetical protein
LNNAQGAETSSTFAPNVVLWSEVGIDNDPDNPKRDDNHRARRAAEIFMLRYGWQNSGFILLTGKIIKPQPL